MKVRSHNTQCVSTSLSVAGQGSVAWLCRYPVRVPGPVSSVVNTPPPSPHHTPTAAPEDACSRQLARSSPAARDRGRRAQADLGGENIYTAGPGSSLKKNRLGRGRAQWASGTRVGLQDSCLVRFAWKEAGSPLRVRRPETAVGLEAARRGVQQPRVRNNYGMQRGVWGSQSSVGTVMGSRERGQRSKPVRGSSSGTKNHWSDPGCSDHLAFTGGSFPKPS